VLLLPPEHGIQDVPRPLELVRILPEQPSGRPGEVPAHRPSVLYPNCVRDSDARAGAALVVDGPQVVEEVGQVASGRVKTWVRDRSRVAICEKSKKALHWRHILPSTPRSTQKL
jgi:hypothetical protein